MNAIEPRESGLPYLCVFGSLQKRPFLSQAGHPSRGPDASEPSYRILTPSRSCGYIAAVQVAANSDEGCGCRGSVTNEIARLQRVHEAKQGKDCTPSRFLQCATSSDEAQRFTIAGWAAGSE